MKELLLQLAAYNLWAHRQLLDVISLLPEAQQKASLPSSFSSLHDTIIHLWNAESIWWQRLRLQELIISPGDKFIGTTKEAGEQLLMQSRQWHEWIYNAQEHKLQHVFQYQNSKKEQFKQPVYQMLLHLFNHGTYHRGQLVNMLRQLGVSKIPPSDFIVWSRMKSNR